MFTRKQFDVLKEWGRFYESAVGAHIVGQAFVDRYEVFYWRQGNDEVDYVIQKKEKRLAIEVKSKQEELNLFC